MHQNKIMDLQQAIKEVEYFSPLSASLLYAQLAQASYAQYSREELEDWLMLDNNAIEFLDIELIAFEQISKDIKSIQEEIINLFAE